MAVLPMIVLVVLPVTIDVFDEVVVVVIAVVVKVVMFSPVVCVVVVVLSLEIGFPEHFEMHISRLEPNPLIHSSKQDVI